MADLSQRKVSGRPASRICFAGSQTHQQHSGSTAERDVARRALICCG